MVLICSSRLSYVLSGGNQTLLQCFFLSLKVIGREGLVPMVFYKKVNFESPKQIKEGIMKV